VIERLIDAACALDYPADRLEVQVLDDSTDETAALAAARVAWHRAQGRHVVHLRRPERRGFKAGALEAGLKTARGELIAVFDADFVPAPDFLRRCVDAFVDPEVGMVQARWGHLNAAYSTLTRAQAALLDGHFLIEHASRHAAGHFFNFNGTAGIWRRACIESAGGWQHDTLTEDLDLSYRAQLNGWRFLYRGEVVAPAELPVEMTAFKGQQRRWAKGSIQTGIKLLPRILCSRLPVGIKLEAFFHLTSNLCYLWMVLLALLLPAAVVARAGYHGLFWTALDAPLFLLSLLSVTRFYVEAQRELEPGLRGRLLRIPVLMALGIGMALSNGLAVLEALFGVRTPFLRTPKHRIERRTDRPVGYHSPGGMMPLIELAMAAYLMAGMGLAMRVGMWWSLPFMALFVAGYLFVGLSSMPGWRAAGATP
jgi:cellulose synthase/poly-beta-1,6-N-acetylglucosamine synthase-like glycosyltransferase